MRKLLAISRKELNVFFHSPIPYISIGIFGLIIGYIFNAFLAKYLIVQRQQMMFGGAMGGGGLSIHVLLQATFQNIHFFLMLTIPFLTMRSIAEERANQTAALLFTVPLRVSQILGGKFLSLMAVMLLYIAYTAFVPIFCFVYSTPDLSMVLYSYVGLICLAMAYVSLGIFCSTLTKNQMLAGVLAFVFCISFFLFGVLTRDSTHIVAQVFNYLSVTGHVQNFFKGVFSLKDVMYFVSFSFFWLFLSHQMLEGQGWR